jgi:hypothetical protein
MRKELTPEQKAKPYSKYYYLEEAPVPTQLTAEMNKSPMDPNKAIPVDKADDLFIPGYNECETGYCLMPDGTGYVSALIDMPNVTAEMIEWYFAWFALDDLRYMIWDPSNHHAAKLERDSYSRRLDYRLGDLKRRWKTAFVATEDIGAGSIPLRISFLSPEDFGHDMRKFVHPNATVNNINIEINTPRVGLATVSHVYRKTNKGLELRARFWLGWNAINGEKVLVNNKIQLPQAKGLAYHCLAEYTNLAAILPQLYKENHETLDRIENFSW